MTSGIGPLRFIVSSGGSVRQEELIERLEALGLSIDKSYAPVVVDPASGCFVLRGEGSRELMDRATRELGVKMYPDQSIGIGRAPEEES